MKTAVEWLESEMQKVVYIAKSNKLKFDELMEQAKEMEREQMIEFACQVYDKYNFGTQEISFREECEQYYNETFKQDEQ
jgi:hypothetical protein